MIQKIAVLGGDARERYVAERLIEENMSVSTWGIEGAACGSKSPEQCLKGASALLLPVVSNNKEGKLFAPSSAEELYIEERHFAALAKNAPIYAGVASTYLKQVAAKTNHPLFEILELDAVAIPNAELTAEGALFLIMQHFNVSIRDLKVAIFGFGRVGKACAALFTRVGMKVVVFCRKAEDLAVGRSFGFDMRYYNGTEVVLPHCPLIVNTVPKKIITTYLAKDIKKDALILDLASAPGGVEEEAKQIYHLEVITSPGLPGKYAPKSAASVIAAYYLKSLCGKGGEPI